MEKINKQQDSVEEVMPPEAIEMQESQAVGSPKSILLWIAIVILLGLIAGSFWLMQQQLKKLEAPVVIDPSPSIERLENKVAQLKQTVIADRSMNEQRLSALTTENIALLERINRLAETQESTNDDAVGSWILAELAFLLQTANQSVLLSGNVDKAISALFLADQQLKSLTDPHLSKLRSLIADEKLALESVKVADIDGLAMALHSALKMVDQLPILMGTQLGVQDASDSSVTSSSSWRQALSEGWQQIKSLVVIRHREDADVAVLVPEQRYFLYQNLSLKLESARLALLSGKEQVFHDSLFSAEQWLQQYFTGAQRDAMLEQLKSMQSETITIEMPDISASLIWLQQYENGEQP